MHQQEKKRLSWVTSCGPNPQVSHTDSFNGVQFFSMGKGALLRAMTGSKAAARGQPAALCS